jgi:hypothetical protein
VTTSAEARVLMAGQAEAIAQLVANAPPLPAVAVDVLAGAALPVRSPTTALAKSA